MDNHMLMILFFFFFSSILCPVLLSYSFQSIENDILNLQTYIVQLKLPSNNIATFERELEDLESWYMSFLPNSSTTEEASSSNLSRARMVYKYKEAITGFAAKLSAAELMEIEKKEGFVKAYPDHLLPLLTTHTPTFLGLQQGNGLWGGSSFGKGVIIGMLDTGVVPSHPSFNDDGMPPPPIEWKGECMFMNNTGCNNKIIGARTFGSTSSSTTPPVDDVGHGTHTASTAAGNFVANANVFGNGNGTAAGMAPRAHLAIYRVCDAMGCLSSSILAGMDAAIRDGVHILSLSLGGDFHRYNDDVIAIGAFSAIQKGIFVSCAAGNAGPDPGSLINEAPWVLTVGASTMDRSIRVTIKLGDGQEFDGESAFQPAADNFKFVMLPLVYPSSGNCNLTTLGKYVKGKIVVCRRPLIGSRILIGSVVKKAGGAGMILVNNQRDGYSTMAEAHVLPASHISYDDGKKIFSYYNSTTEPTATLIFKGTIIGNVAVSAPTVASFSSRGPSIASPSILKPDVIGPGVSVVAGWPSQIEPYAMHEENDHHTFNIISGTSMSTPHLSGIAALVKGMHPDWSPAAIKSAIMTTSDTLLRHDGTPITDEQRNPASYFMMGGGHVNPDKAYDPGLVYDITVEDYISFLCGLGYSDKDMEVITTHRQVTCANLKKIQESELNYPSITVSLASGQITVNRTVTHVSELSEKYTAEVAMPDGIDASVVPNEMQFSEVNEQKSFVITLTRSNKGKGIVVAEGHIKWISDKHVVRSPILVTK